MSRRGSVLKPDNKWPRDITSWIDDRVFYMSVPFTWLLPDAVKMVIEQQLMLWDRVVVGGPAVELNPGCFDFIEWVTERKVCNGVLQQVNSEATKTTVGCPNRCKFCAVPRIEGPFRELDDWPDLPVLVDNNLLAASQTHLNRVFDRLEKWGRVDFNQGLDAARLNQYHVKRIIRIGKPMIRIALDHHGQEGVWERAFDLLRKYKVPKSRIRSYALIAFDTGPGEAWDRCEWIEGHGVKALPMWFHELDATKVNSVTGKQRELGWDDFERRRIMRWFYQHARETQKTIEQS